MAAATIPEGSHYYCQPLLSVNAYHQSFKVEVHIGYQCNIMRMCQLALKSTEELFARGLQGSKSHKEPSEVEESPCFRLLHSNSGGENGNNGAGRGMELSLLNHTWVLLLHATSFCTLLALSWKNITFTKL